jgi:RimJ/RimL family protein N-acetyltransferase
MTNETKTTAPVRAGVTAHLPADDWALLNIALEARFKVGADGRIKSENYPDLSPAPLMFMAGYEAGNLVRLSPDVDEATAAKIEALAASEPPLQALDSAPLHLPRYLDLLCRTAAVRPSAGLTFHLPHNVRSDREPHLVFSGMPDGRRLQDSLARDGMPPALIEMGFRSVEDLWEPWCLALDDGEVASLAFAARLGHRGAELGLATSPLFRGRGLAAAATAGWTSHPALADHVLFYSTAKTNLASQRVVAKLGLRLIGATMEITRDA